MQVSLKQWFSDDIIFTNCYSNPCNSDYFCLSGINILEFKCIDEVLGTYIIDFPSDHSKNEINESMQIPVEDPFFLIFLPSNTCLFCDGLGVLYTYNFILKKHTYAILSYLILMKL